MWNVIILEDVYKCKIRDFLWQVGIKEYSDILSLVQLQEYEVFEVLVVLYFQTYSDIGRIMEFQG